MNKKFISICNRLAAFDCYNSGQTVKQIAESAKVHKSTVYKWLKTFEG